MIDKQVELLKKMFALIVNPPTVTLDVDFGLDEPVILINSGQWSINNTKLANRKGVWDVDGFELTVATYQGATRWEPENHDYAILSACNNFVDVAHDAVRYYLYHQINNMLENESLTAYCSELEQSHETN